MAKRCAGLFVAVTAIVVVVGAQLVAADASAQDAVEPEPIVGVGGEEAAGVDAEATAGGDAERLRPISVALLLGFGGALGEDFNPWGFGFGVRGGYNLGRLYLGGRFVYHLGSSDDVVSPGGGLIEVDYSLWELGAEAGYDFAVAERIIVRPSVVLGVANVISSTDAPLFGESISASGTDAKLLLSLGASALYDIDPMWFVGADLRLPLALGGGSVVGLVFYASGGARF